MIVGTGIDLIEVERIRGALNKPGFLERVYTKAEQEYLTEKKQSPECAAGIFAAKEAVAKALGTGFHGFGLRDIEIVHDALGRPAVRLYGGAESRRQEIHCGRLHVSITHIKSMAAAQAVAEE